MSLHRSTASACSFVSYEGSLVYSLNCVFTSDIMEPKHDTSTVSLEGQHRVENDNNALSRPERKSQDPLVHSILNLPLYEPEC